MEQVTQILEAIGRGEKKAEDLLPLVYDELRRLAASRLARESPGQTLQATALVHEAYLRLLQGDQQSNWDNKGHFFAAAAEAMRRILIDRARQKQSLKRGGDRDRVELMESDLVISIPHDELIDVNDALEKLEQEEPVTAQVVKLRFFAGLSMEEIAEALQVSPRTASKHWAYARAWIYNLLKQKDPS